MSYLQNTFADTRPSLRLHFVLDGEADLGDGRQSFGRTGRTVRSRRLQEPEVEV